MAIADREIECNCCHQPIMVGQEVFYTTAGFGNVAHPVHLVCSDALAMAWRDGRDKTLERAKKLASGETP